MLPTFLLSTSKEFGIVENGKFRTIFAKRNGMFFGITWCERYVYVLSRNGGPGIAESIEIFDRDLRHVDRICLRGKCSSGHQLFYCPQTSQLYLMNTNNKMINVFSGKKLVRQVKWLGADECTHINSIWSPDGKTFYVCEHNGCNPPSRIIRCDNELNVEKIFPNTGLDCHCIYIDKDELITASSKEFGIVRYDMKTKTRIHFRRISALDSDKWYTRGLGVRPSYFMLGLSAHQDIREKRSAERQGGVVMLDTDFNVMQEIAVGSRGQILDLRIIGDQDLAHNGIAF